MLTAQHDRSLESYGCTYLGPDYDSRTHPYAEGVPTPYCGCKDLVPGTLYCRQHHAGMYVKGSAQRKRHKDLRRVTAIRQLESLFNEAVAELEAEGFDFTAEPCLDQAMTYGPLPTVAEEDHQHSML